MNIADMTFDSGGFQSFDNDTGRNVIIFGIDNSSSSHSDDRKNNFLILGAGLNFGVNGNFGSPKIKFSITSSVLVLVKQTQNLV